MFFSVRLNYCSLNQPFSVTTPYTVFGNDSTISPCGSLKSQPPANCADLHHGVPSSFFLHDIPPSGWLGSNKYSKFELFERHNVFVLVHPSSSSLLNVLYHTTCPKFLKQNEALPQQKQIVSIIFSSRIDPYHLQLLLFSVKAGLVAFPWTPITYELLIRREPFRPQSAKTITISGIRLYSTGRITMKNSLFSTPSYRKVDSD